jgi:DMSO/TMAO reductase YedYZ molybdopterin-dependent catalytic subunit
MGPHLLECSGNNNPANFGLMGVCEWDAVPLTSVVARLSPSRSATAVLVGGMDPDQDRHPLTRSKARAGSPLTSLERLGAFLAVRMNGSRCQRITARRCASWCLGEMRLRGSRG